MAKKSSITFLIALLIGGFILAFAIARQSRIDIRFQVAPGRGGQVIIDSRSKTQPPALPPDQM